MNDTTRPQHFNEERSKAIEQLLANVARNRLRSTFRYEQLIRKLPQPETSPDHGDSVADAVD